MSQLHALDTSTSKQVFVECTDKALKTHDTTIHTKLDTLSATVTGGTAKTLIVGANDINGGTPHRHLTVDGNGRLLTYPYEHPSSWTNTHLQTIITNTATIRAQGILMTSQLLGTGIIHGTHIDARSYKSIRIFGNTLGMSDFYIMGSQDDTDYFVIKNVYPVTGGDFGDYLEDCPPYIKIKANSSETITVHYSMIN